MRKIFVGSRPSSLDKAINLRQLAIMLRSGVPLTRALKVLSHPAGQPELAAAWGDVLQSVMSGRGLARAMAAHSRVFSLSEVGMVRAAERSSCLEETLDHLADYLEHEHNLTSKVTHALQYPLFVLSMALLGMVAFMTHIFPVFMQGLNGEVELPLLTRILLLVANILSNPRFLAVMVGVLVLGAYLGMRYYRTPQGRYQWQHALLQWRFVGAIIRQTMLARFCRSLAVLMQSGMPLKLCLDVAGDALAFHPLAEAVHSVSGDMCDGCTLSQAFAYSPFFPRFVSRMLAVSEEADDVRCGFARLGEHYEQQVSMALEQFTVLLEPLTLAIVGVFMGGTLVGMFLPLYSCINTLG